MESNNITMINQANKNNDFCKWVAAWGNATSITDRTECTYAKDLTLRYPIKMCFDADKIRLHFSNLTGTEDVILDKVVVAVRDTAGTGRMDGKRISLNQNERIVLPAGAKDVLSDELDFCVSRGDILEVSIYLADYTQMNAGTLVTGPLSKGKYSYGDFAECDELPVELTRNTNWFYFLNTVDVHTYENNHAIICYGDSITAQSWPDYLINRLFDEKIENVSIIRRAVSGTRILREYSCITYAAYGLKGATRFPIESEVSGADTVIIQHGINDIIHPVGEDVNIFRPWSDMPTAEQLVEGIEKIYVEPARQKGLKVYSGTLLPIYGWRTYEPFRDDIRNKLNCWLRESDVFDGCVDFDVAVRDLADTDRFAEGFDSGDHLHPSEAAYKAMADCVPDELLKA